MNKILETYARNWLKENLPHCTYNQKQVFKQMYSSKNVSLDIETIIDNMPTDQLDYAIEQVERTIDKNEVKE